MLFMGTNHPVQITDNKSGILRRLIIISPTGNTFEPNEYFDGYEKKKFNAFYYMVDGKKIDFGSSFQPASKYEILENEADYIDEEYRMVILNCCS